MATWGPAHGLRRLATCAGGALCGLSAAPKLAMRGHRHHGRVNGDKAANNVRYDARLSCAAIVRLCVRHHVI